MREILFRGKRLDNGEWVEGAFCPKNSEGDIPCIIVYNGTIAGWWFEVDPATVGQYTGLMANGKRIFEGDILSLITSRTHEVKFTDGWFYMEGTAIPIKYAEKFRIIGNIHDNPELLEVTPDE